MRRGSVNWAALAFLLATTTVWAEIASSPSYVLQQTTTDGAGAVASSAGFVLHGAAAQKAVVGTSSSPAYVLQSGFFSFVGSGLVPVVLAVEKDIVDPENVDLTWSGNNSPYDVYRSADCADVTNNPLTQVGGNNYDDDTVPAGGLHCYRVLATAPGPAPPPPDLP